MEKNIKIAYEVSDSPRSREMLKRLSRQYKGVSVKQAHVIVAIGGDGFMLHILHKYINTGKKVYGVNCGTIGFLLNSIDNKDLLHCILSAKEHILNPLQMSVTNTYRNRYKALGFNEVSLFRTTGQALHLKIAVKDRIRLSTLVCDGILVATPAGSTAYNLSAHGPVLPIDSNILALTPISPFRPRRWRGALLPSNVKISVDVLAHKKRPAAAVADNMEIKNVTHLSVKSSVKDCVCILTNADHDLEERIISEQFH